MEIEKYLNVVNEIILFEFDRANLLEIQSEEAQTQALETALIVEHSSVILERGFSQLIKGQNLDSLRLLFTFFKETKLSEQLKQAWVGFIRVEGNAIL